MLHHFVLKAVGQTTARSRDEFGGFALDLLLTRFRDGADGDLQLP
jgi:hypothetical protein